MGEEQLSFVEIGDPQPMDIKRKGRFIDRAHPAPPGTGPAGRTCLNCSHRITIHMAKNYQKCDLIEWTHGGATDIRCKDLACRRYEERKP